MDAPKDLRRRGIQSVEIGLRVLSTVAAFPSAATLSAIAQHAELSPSQAHRYLTSLIAAGMVRQEARSGLYDLDSGAIRIGLAALTRLDLFAMADQTFSAFSRETGRTCLIAVWGTAGPTIVRWFPGYPPVTTSLAIGSTLPLRYSATGHVFLTFGDPGSIELHARATGADGAEEEAIRTRVRRSLSARVAGDLIPGLRAMSVPVFDLQGRLSLVATALATSAFDAAEDGATTEALIAACRSLTEALGGPWPSGETETLPKGPGDGDRASGRRRAANRADGR